MIIIFLASAFSDGLNNSIKNRHRFSTETLLNNWLLELIGNGSLLNDNTQMVDDKLTAIENEKNETYKMSNNGNSDGQAAPDGIISLDDSGKCGNVDDCFSVSIGLINLIFFFIENPSEVEPATVSVKNTVKNADNAMKVEPDEPKNDHDAVNDAAAEIETKPKQKKPASTKPRRKKVRISTENLAHVKRAKKRSTIKGRRTSIIPRRSSTGRKSNVNDAPADSKPFKCAVYGCKYAGAKKHYLTLHMKSHDKDKLIDCNKCDMKFKSTEPYLKHMSKHA